MDYKSNQCAEKTVQLNGIIQSEKLENWKYILRFNSSPFPAVLLLLSFATLARSSLIHFHVIVLSRRNKGPSVNQSVSHRNIFVVGGGRGWLVVKRADPDLKSGRPLVSSGFAAVEDTYRFCQLTAEQGQTEGLASEFNRSGGDASSILGKEGDIKAFM